MLFWSVVQSHPACEHRAITNIERQGYACYAPRERVTRVVRGRKVTEARWLFPRYLFVWIIDRWWSLFGTFGVSSVIMNGDKPARIPNGWVEKMKAREVKGLIDLSQSEFTKGQRVQVTSGLFMGKHGIYQGQTSRQREVILLEALGRVELAPGMLR
jgi:transcriptional antiterminator RfaH